ncbi:hypothetical protein BT96DRAFT_919359 [Gymnopus androsaceus JB14]|uniref:Glycosyltransferase family 1 protein n=1 Tax=Gymnopus androsaceus JB14 TaxID=1447944 RepID=A0A6A4HRY6_9AGAR|nr:hypothetical protein BT96DRAFT_919359 [Gymnopus androsaceus JB14]
MISKRTTVHPKMQRNTIRIAAALFVLMLFGAYKQGVHRTIGSWNRESEVKESEVKLDFTRDQVWVFEEYVHDEVNGAIGVSLQAANVVPTFACHFRHEFTTILSSILHEPPTIVPPNGPALHDALAADSIENLVLTTCTDSLKKHQKNIYASTVHVVCLIHHSNVDVYRELKPLMEPLAAQGRLSLLVLGEHVRKAIQADIYDWIERMESPIWENVPLETMIPVFDYPGLAERPEPCWNIEHGRRNYDKLLADLKDALIRSPATWGWKGAEGSPFQPILDASPFTLHLVGQINPEHHVLIPTELKDVVHIHEGLPYPEFYQFISQADIMVPAFMQRGAYEDTTSSSIAAAAITRIPVLASARHLGAYTYLTGPSVIERNISTSEVAAIGALRRGPQPRRRAGTSVWNEFQDNIIYENAKVWARLLRHRSPTLIPGTEDK